MFEVPKAANDNERAPGQREFEIDAARERIEAAFDEVANNLEAPKTFSLPNGEIIDCLCEEENQLALQQKRLEVAKELAKETERYDDIVAQALVVREEAALEAIKAELFYKSKTNQLPNHDSTPIAA